jgi:adenylate kinase
MSQIQRQKRIVIVGIPGVGKSTVVNEVLEIQKQKGVDAKVANYGTVMMEEATRLYNVSSRDEMRKLSIEAQRKLQLDAAAKIKSMEDKFLIVDTHLFIATREGYWPGMPLGVLQKLEPTNLVLVSADSETILSRRQKDTTRKRDPSTKDSIDKDLIVASTYLFASSLLLGCPALVVQNKEGQASETAQEIIKAIESS